MTFAFHNNPHLFNKHLLSAYYVPGAILSIGNTAVKKSLKIPILTELTMLTTKV